MAQDQSYRLRKIPVLVADRDSRTAGLVQGVLRGFGFSLVDRALSTGEVITLLKRRAYGIIITEWHLATEDGIHLVRSIRRFDRSLGLPRDIPIIMLTAKADFDAVRYARDAGITEFVAKPFTAQTLSHRLVQVIDNPRNFVDAESFAGPCRRRREAPTKGEERRGKRDLKVTKPALILPPNRSLKEKIGLDLSASDIFTQQLIAQVQRDLQAQESAFIEWANDDVLRLERAYRKLQDNSKDATAFTELYDAAYSIHALAGVFGYDLGTDIAKCMLDYLQTQTDLNRDSLVIARKHIDAIGVIFHKKIKHEVVGAELLKSLKLLVQKLG